MRDPTQSEIVGLGSVCHCPSSLAVVAIHRQPRLRRRRSPIKLSRSLGLWGYTATLTGVTGGGCVGQLVLSLIGTAYLILEPSAKAHAYRVHHCEAVGTSAFRCEQLASVASW